MGTNYYLEPRPPCSCCGRSFKPRHIGKSSGGWCFALRVYPEEGIHDLQEWLPLLNTNGAVIRDEYGRTVAADELLQTITERSSPASCHNFDYHANDAAPGPNNLVRHRVDGRHCIGHGEGTWDLIAGEFS